jgi:hypothetical protein|tara:strand:- start:925 stop:1038 length:114 start_codon:yes stop_codon:yes gene_type:complete
MAMRLTKFVQVDDLEGNPEVYWRKAGLIQRSLAGALK